MKTTRFCSLFVLFFSLAMQPLQVKAQLGPSLTSPGAPQASDPICTIPLYLGSFYTTGPAVGSLSPDFTLHGLNGDSLHLAGLLAGGKPLLLVNGSLTCPVFRNKIPALEQMALAYAGLLEVAIVITVEAHPTDVSPYFGYVNITSQNQQEGILYPQPLSYGDRANLAQIAVNHSNITVPVYLDRPCQEWWNYFGPAPNNAYVFLPNGQIAIKHGWFHRTPDQMFCDLDSILNVSSGSCQANPSFGNFRAEPLNLQSSGNPGDVLFNYIDLIAGPQGDAQVLIMKIEEQYGPGWESAFCADICYSSVADSIVVTIPANDTMHFSLDFLSPANPGSSTVKLGFRNQNNSQNKYSFVLEASTLSSGFEQTKKEQRSSTYLLKIGQALPEAWGKVQRMHSYDGRLLSTRGGELPSTPGFYWVICEGRPYRMLLLP